MLAFLTNRKPARRLSGSFTENACISDEPYNGPGVLQIPEQTHRHHFVKAAVKVHQYPDGALAVFHGPLCLARYAGDGSIIRETNVAA